MEEIDPDNGSIKIGVNTSFSYFQQNITEFDNDQTVLEYIQDFAHNIRTADGILHSASEMLQRFLFDGKMQQNKLEKSPSNMMIKFFSQISIITFRNWNGSGLSDLMDAVKQLFLNALWRR